MRRTDARLRLGVSSCLLGERVRYDGGHKRHPVITEELGEHVDWVAVCPELELGLGTPRAPIRLVRDRGGGVRLLQPATGLDLTEQMRRFAEARVATLELLDLDGYVFKSGSPSCGLFEARGLFAQVLTERLPDLPVEEEGGLDDDDRRAAFLQRVHVYRQRR